MDLISIIVPVYNGEKYIERCIKSLLNQTIIDKMEVIVVNDGSTDNTEKILKKYATQLKIVTKSNAGLPQARKTGLENSSGNYIGFVDADDWIEKTMYQTLYQQCIDNKCEVSVCGFYLEYENKRKSIRKNVNEISVYSGIESLEFLHKREKIYTYLWNKLYKKELFDQIEFSHGNFVGEDYDIITKILKKAQKVSWNSSPLYHYVQLKGSMCRGGYSDSYKIAFEKYKINSNCIKNEFPELSFCVDNYVLTEYLSFVVAMGKNGNYNNKMIHDIISFSKKHKKQFLCAGYVSMLNKIALIAFCINYKILVKGYQIVYMIYS